MANSTRKKIKAGEAVNDIRSGMTDADLREKYGLSPQGLALLFGRLADAGLLERHELEHLQGWRDSSSGELTRKPPAAAWPVRPRGFDGAPDTTQFTQEDDRFLKTTPDDSADSVPEVRHLERTEWIMLLVTPLIALLCFVFFWPAWILSTFTILSHEMGHAIFGWVFGYPSFPQFDILYGGGLTRHFERYTILLIVIYLGFGVLAYLNRGNRPMLTAIVAVALTHGIISSTSMHSVIILFMGHGTELIIAGLFIFRCLSGRAVVHPAERPLYGVIGFFIVFYDLRFAYGLLTSRLRVEEYLDGKADLDNDFVRIAYDHLHVNMSSVVLLFFVCCVLSPLLSFLAFRYMEYLHAGIAAVLHGKADAVEETTL
ncbi:MAG: hypothetical protein HY914_19205 [Desulfomonile tiedjei]|nr:hypothetical protein [Desulfomonile tiedjei]